MAQYILIKGETILERLKRLCNPTNYMDNYDKEKVSAANIIYAKLLSPNPDIETLATQAEDKLEIQIIDAFQIKDLKDKVHPKNFMLMQPYNEKMVALANELYSKITKSRIRYTDYLEIIDMAKPILDYWEEKEKEEQELEKAKIKKEMEMERRYKEQQKRIENAKRVIERFDEMNKCIETIILEEESTEHTKNVLKIWIIVFLTITLCGIIWSIVSC